MYNKNINKMTNEQLRMQMLAGIITEGQYKEKLNEAEGASLKDFALQKIKPYLEKNGYKVGFFNSVPSIPMEKMKDDKTLAGLVLDGTGTHLTVVLANGEKAAKILGASDSQEGQLMKDLGLKSYKDAEKGETYFQDRRFYGDGLGITLMAKP
jgi:hypothetical protein